MPFNKRSKTVLKRANFRNKIKIAIKRRLMEISIRIDGYIYKNKPITVEEAQKYMHEVSILRSQCNKDIRILQVAEKLTRCMKTIIEETTKKVPNRNVAASENEQAIGFFNESSSLNNKYENRNIIIDNCNLQTTIQVVKTNKYEISHPAVTIIVSDNENEEIKNKNNVKPPVYDENIQDISMGDCSIFNISGMNELNTQHSLIKTQISRLSNSNIENSNHLKQGQIYYNNIVYKQKQVMNDNCNSTLRNSKKTRKFKKKITSVENSQQKFEPPKYNTNSRNIKSKNRSSLKQKPTLCWQAVNLEATLNINTPKKLKIAYKKNKSLVPNKNSNNHLPQTINKRKQCINNNNKNEPRNFKESKDFIPSSSSISPLFCATPNKQKQAHIDVTSDEVSLPMLKANVKGKRQVKNSHEDLIAKQMGALRIHNKHILNDLSWIEDIRYVREISINEYDSTLNKFNEIFWESFSLPNDWNDVDFLD